MKHLQSPVLGLIFIFPLKHIVVFFFLSVCLFADAEPPWIQCPGNIVAETDERRGTANVSWNVPTATDNSKEEVRYFTECLK